MISKKRSGVRLGCARPKRKRRSRKKRNDAVAQGPSQGCLSREQPEHEEDFLNDLLDDLLTPDLIEERSPSPEQEDHEDFLERIELEEAGYIFEDPEHVLPDHDGEDLGRDHPQEPREYLVERLPPPKPRSIPTDAPQVIHDLVAARGQLGRPVRWYLLGEKTFLDFLTATEDLGWPHYQLDGVPTLMEKGKEVYLAAVPENGGDALVLYDEPGTEARS